MHTALSGVELILHAGDVGGDEILMELGLIAPVRAVYGNTDAPGQPGLAAAIDIAIDGVSIHVSHGHEVGVADSAEASWSVTLPTSSCTATRIDRWSRVLPTGWC